MNANDAAATAKHTDLTAAKILFAQTAKGQDVLTEDIIDRLAGLGESMTTLKLIGDLHDRIEAQAAEIEALKTLLAATAQVAASHFKTAKERAAEIERLREALEHIENYYGDGHRITELARAALGETE